MTSPKLATQTGSGRMYSRAVGGEAIVPSITTVIGMDNMDLSGWAGYMAAKSLSEDQRLAQALADRRQLRSLVRDAANAADIYRDQAAARGDRVHNYAEAWALQALGQEHDLAGAKAQLEANNELAYAQHFESWWADYKVEPLAAEVTVWNDTVGYAGTIDLVAKIGGRVCIVDYKTKTSDRDGIVKRPDDKVIMQLAAACKAEEQVVDAEAGVWKPWDYGTDTVLLAVALGETGTRTFMAPESAMPDYWAKFFALRRNWEATHKISRARATLAEITPPAQ
ncbi:PD-(D/E)XK nuclease family protein [Glutamicibacter sp. JL.03c]|uniref:PD-(D/E)XK nuclease family protein n=1 Tax=Glutamicibacter sp. JL.03c TaxID=2984842 RepID=UPI0021F7883F|nr:PD-(D/E)XK nuclease family protein [Glutamicibacter sp. JL.03c]UYQ76291.1 PD-(D/E)XK nuclease family protein [Glutamicibacter sp. JL.03c]